MPALLEPISVREALQAKEVRIEVLPREIRTIGPFEERAAEAYRVADVQSFADLQALGLVPHGLSEQHAQEAMRADDVTFRERQREAGECACQEGRSANGLARRSRIQASLAEALPAAFRSRAGIEEEHPGVVQVYH